MNYDIQFDGTQYAISVQNIEPSMAFKIMDILHDRVLCTAPVVTYRSEAERAWKLNADNVILAIKEMRSRTSLGLKEAKDCIDFARGSVAVRPEYYDDRVTEEITERVL